MNVVQLGCRVETMVALENYLTGIESPANHELSRPARRDRAQGFPLEDLVEGRGRLRDEAAEGANRVFILMPHLGDDEPDEVATPTEPSPSEPETA